MKKLRIAFHAEMVNVGVNRGAQRLFRAIVSELSKRDDIEVICLGQKVSDKSDPVGAVYLSVPINDSRAGEATFFEDQPSLERPPVPDKVVQFPNAIIKLAAFYKNIRAYYSNNISENKRRALRPIMSFVEHGVYKIKICIINHYTVVIRDVAANVQAGAADSGVFSNSSIIRDVVSLEDVDILINFWWFHSPKPNPMIGCYRPKSLRVCAWFLDGIPLRMPNWQMGMIPVEEFRGHVQSLLDGSDEIITISQSAAQDIASFFPHIRKPVHVVPCGVYDDDFITDDDAEAIPGVDRSNPIFTFVGAMEPSKNLPNALRALATVAEKIGQKVNAIVIGNVQYSNLHDLLGAYAKDVTERVNIVLTHHVDDDIKRKAIACASALVYVSKWEGFGIPPLEAMAASVPIVVSDVPAIREVCEGVAEFCDPYDPNDIAEAILRVLNWDDVTKASRISLGLAKARSYSWPAAAEKLLQQLR